MAKDKTFEDNLKELETIIDALENKELSLQDSIKEYKKGVVRLKACNDQITSIEKELEIVNAKED